MWTKAQRQIKYLDIFVLTYTNTSHGKIDNIKYNLKTGSPISHPHTHPFYGGGDGWLRTIIPQ